MPLDVGRVTHLIEQMHRSEDDAGDPIDDDLLLAADGARGLKWVDPGTIGAGDAILRHTGAAEWFLDHGNTGATETINLTAANQHWITLDDDCTLIFTGAVADIDGQDVGSSFTLYVEQDGTGGREITWPGSVQWPGGTDPVLSTAPGSVDILTFLSPDGGTTWYGFFGVAPIGLADTVVAETTFGLAADAGVASQASRSDHTHGTPDEPEGGGGGGTAGFLLIADVHSSPIVFGDILQADDHSDLLYSEA